MNLKRFIFASLAVFITFEIFNFIIHSVILSRTYESLSFIWRPDMMSIMWIMSIAIFIFAFLFVYIYSRGFGQGLLTGIRYGLVIGIIVICVPAFNQYVVYPIPFKLVIQWCIYGLIQCIFCGMVASLIYKSKK